MSCALRGVVQATIRVVHGKQTHHVDLTATDTVGDIKQELESRTNVPKQNQKLMLKKRQLKDDAVVPHTCTHPRNVRNPEDDSSPLDSLEL